MEKINDIWFIFYWRNSSDEPYLVSQPFTMGEIIEGGIEMEFNDGSSLPINDVDWAGDELLVAQVPARPNSLREENRDE